MREDVATTRGGAPGCGGAEHRGRVDAAAAVRSAEVFARENPHVALAAAVGAGFLLGGGLTPRLLAALGLFAARSYLRDTISDALSDIAEQQHNGRREEESNVHDIPASSKERPTGV